MKLLFHRSIQHLPPLGVNMVQRAFGFLLMPKSERHEKAPAQRQGPKTLDLFRTLQGDLHDDLAYMLGTCKGTSWLVCLLGTQDHELACVERNP